jgi:hypothetical protein
MALANFCLTPRSIEEQMSSVPYLKRVGNLSVGVARDETPAHARDERHLFLNASLTAEMGK